ncbi:MAG: hypothetical protein RIQ94_2768 [Pseudomonadota bacterium]|jgi:hypothetical protein
MIQIAFRFDDPSVTSNHSLETLIIQLCCQYNIPINFAVIPFRKIEGQLIHFNKSKASHLIKAYHAGSIEISQHGYIHENNAIPSKKNPSEFVALTFEQQFKWLIEGKKIISQLFGDQSIGFVPPWNSFDANTLLAANRLNYSFVSAGWEIPSLLTNAIPIIPRTCQLKNVMAAIDNAQLFTKLNPVIIVVLHHYDFDEIHEAISPLVRLENLFQLINRSESITITSLNKIAHQYNPELSEYNIKLYADRQKLHWRIKKYLPEDFIFITEKISTIKFFLLKIKNILSFSTLPSL